MKDRVLSSAQILAPRNQGCQPGLCGGLDKWGADMGDRMVFVVHADNFGEFLEMIEASPSDATTERNALYLRGH